MPETKINTPKAKTIFSISKEVNRQSSEVLDYLKRIGIDAGGIMSKVDDSVYKKILGHFKSDIEEAEKHKQKLLEFQKKHKSIEFTEIEEELKVEKEKKIVEEEVKRKKHEEEEKRKKERELQLQKELDEKKRLIEEKKEQLEKEKELEEEMKKKAAEEAKKAAEKPKVKVVKEKEIEKEKEKPKPVKVAEAKKETVQRIVPPEIIEKKPGAKYRKETGKRIEPPKRREGAKAYEGGKGSKDVTKPERKFERVTIKDDFRKKKPFPGQRQSPFGRRHREGQGPKSLIEAPKTEKGASSELQ